MTAFTRIQRHHRLQSAADDLSVIGGAVDELGKMLDKFHADHGTEIYDRLHCVWPDAERFGGTASKPIHDLAIKLTPPDSCLSA